MFMKRITWNHHLTNVSGMALLSVCMGTGLLAGNADPPQESPAQAVENHTNASQKQESDNPDKRIFGVLPNFRSTSGENPFEPITRKQKFKIAEEDTFDWSAFVTAAGFAGLSQIQDQNPSFGSGIKGYAKRFGGGYADQAIGNMMTEGVLPSVLHQDPRYFEKEAGGKWSRTKYAVTRILITRSDSGAWRFNTSEVLGNSIAVAISNAYYPGTRDAGDNLEKLGIQLATDAFSNILKEFWPDIHRKIVPHHPPSEEPMATSGSQ